MTKTEAIKELRANGSEQTRKTYRRHGMSGKMFGVSYAALGKIRKKIKVDQALAEQLWETENFDARNLATMIADPAAIRAGTLNTWARESGNRGMAAAVSNVAAGSPHAQKLMEKWTASKNEMIACTGWHTLASLAREDDGLPDTYFEKRPGDNRIDRSLQQELDQVRDEQRVDQHWRPEFEAREGIDRRGRGVSARSTWITARRVVRRPTRLPI